MICNFLHLYKTYKSHSVYRNIPNILELIAPLRSLGVFYFSTVRINNSNEATFFVSDHHGLECYVKSPQFMYEEPLFSPARVLRPGNYCMNKVYAKVYPYVTPSDYKCFVIIKDSDDGVREIFCFAVENADFIDYSLLENFISEFKSKADKLINKADKIFFPLVYPKANPLDVLQESSLLELSLNGNKNFFTKADYNYCKMLQVASMNNLSHREAQCLDMILQGKLNKEIAYRLGLSDKTVEAHVNNIKNKLKCHSKIDLAIKTLSYKIAEYASKSNMSNANTQITEPLNDTNFLQCLQIAKIYDLTLRETQCLPLLIQGKLNKQIAYELNLSTKTIDAYVDNIKHKMNCYSKMDLIIGILTYLTH